MADDFKQAESAPFQDGERSRINACIGAGALYSGVALMALAVIDRISGLPFRMPQSWYHTPSLWVMIELGLIIGGCVLLRRRTHLSAGWSPSLPGIRFRTVTLYTREGCHLCDVAKDTLMQYFAYLPDIDEVDIDENAELHEQFNTCVPVVEIDGRVRFRGEVNEVLLRRMIEAAPLPDLDLTR